MASRFAGAECHRHSVRLCDRAAARVLVDAALWIPVPFYAYSVAYGSVPIFIPVWWPHSYYNTRYGMELLPAIALGLGFVAQFAIGAVREFKPSWTELAVCGAAPALVVLEFARTSSTSGRWCMSRAQRT